MLMDSVLDNAGDVVFHGTKEDVCEYLKTKNYNELGFTVFEDENGGEITAAEYLGEEKKEEICEWCKNTVTMMCQKGTGVCCQECAHYASNILYTDPEKAKKFGATQSG